MLPKVLWDVLENGVLSHCIFPLIISKCHSFSQPRNGHSMAASLRPASLAEMSISEEGDRVTGNSGKQSIYLDANLLKRQMKEENALQLPSINSCVLWAVFNLIAL